MYAIAICARYDGLLYQIHTLKDLLMTYDPITQYIEEIKALSPGDVFRIDMKMIVIRVV